MGAEKKITVSEDVLLEAIRDEIKEFARLYDADGLILHEREVDRIAGGILLRVSPAQ